MRGINTRVPYAYLNSVDWKVNGVYILYVIVVMYSGDMVPPNQKAGEQNEPQW